MLCSITISSCVFSALGQNPDSKRIDHWYFGYGAGLDFSSGTAVADTNGAMHVWKGNTTMSDKEGNLLFYSDGRHVWNAQHDSMPNGDIWGIPPGVFPTDCAISIPKPGDDNIYYIFTSDGTKMSQQNGLQYHIVDMSLQGGLGDVVQKNIPLHSPVTEQLCAVRHGNNCDYWLITHEKHTANYLAFHISGLGVDPIPVVSTNGVSNLPWAQNSAEYTGAIILKAATQGDKLASITNRRWQNTGLSDQVQLSSFDTQTGSVSNSFIIELDSTFSGSCFSPNGQIFYVEHGSYTVELDQFDVSQFDSVAVNNSRFNLRTSSVRTFATDLACANDGKIYGTQPWGYVLNIDSIPVINQPDVWGTGCMIEEWAVGLNGRFSQFAIPETVFDFSAPSAPDHCWAEIAMLPDLAELRLCVDGDLLFLDLGGGRIYETLQASIVDACGRRFCSERIIPTATTRTSFSITGLSPGLYLLRLSGASGYHTSRSFVKPQ
ncbi:MAG: hypothetical protein IPI07_12250 [Flavobacteriales bacterium]|nr:hypothetical protein [Flavobacteriales bacterium]MBK9537326.1 hypothetical protein [Flavobacteriales bacterium]